MAKIDWNAMKVSPVALDPYRHKQEYYQSSFEDRRYNDEILRDFHRCMEYLGLRITDFSMEQRSYDTYTREVDMKIHARSMDDIYRVARTLDRALTLLERHEKERVLRAKDPALSEFYDDYMVQLTLRGE